MCKGKQLFLAGLILVLAFMLIGWGEQVQSQEKYPIKPIDVIVGASAGGSADIGTRIGAAYVSKKWGVSVNIVNKPGGNGVPAALEVYKARPDGYTLLGETQANSSMQTLAVKNLPYDIMTRSYAGTHWAGPACLVVGAASPFKTAGDLIAEIKNNPEKISFGS